MANQIPAWQISIETGRDSSFNIALAQHQVRAYLPDVQLHSVPLAPNFCNSVIIWQERTIPVVNLSTYFSQPALPRSDNNVAIIIYRNNADINYVAVVLDNPPEKITVSDNNYCEWPGSLSKSFLDSSAQAIKPFIVSLFKQRDATVAVVDFARFFTFAISAN